MELLANATALFQKGGLVMYPLAACSITVVAVAVERFLFFRAAETDIDGLVARIEHLLAKGDRLNALEECRNAEGLTAGILAAGLKRPYADSRSMENTLSGAASLAAAALRERLGFLDTIVTLAPLLGLLGTVIGMISSFSVMNIRAGQPQAVTDGVGEALVATAAGLCVAVLALAVHSYFVHRLDGLVTGMERGCNYLLDACSRGEEHETA